MTQTPTVALPVPLLAISLGEMSRHGHRMCPEEARATRRALAQVEAVVYINKLPRPVIGGTGGDVDAVDLALALVGQMEQPGAAEYSIRTPRVKVGIMVPKEPEPKPKPKPSHAAQGRSTRSAIRQALAGGSKTTAELMEAASRTHSTVCHHLRRLEAAGQVERTKQGLAAVWHLTEPQEAAQAPPAPPEAQDTGEEPEAVVERTAPSKDEPEIRGGGVHLL